MKVLKTAVLLAVVVAMIGCSTLVRIETEPKDAAIYIDDVRVGTSPVEEEYSNFVGNQYYIRIEKQGYRTVRTKLQKEIKAGPLIAGLFIWPFLLWCYGPSEVQYYDLERQ